jgi:hypothetical protein
MANAAICYPIPLNVVVATVRGVWMWLRYGYAAVMNDPREAYVQGLHDGLRVKTNTMKEG